jgi:arabinan endo-1,5-alpha-L-arabinosidase
MQGAMKGSLLWAMVTLLPCAWAAPLTYRNPVLSIDFPDPAVVRAPDGTFAAFATGGGEPRNNIQCATSEDLVHWEPHDDALPVLPAWACQNCNRSCAPDVQFHNQTFYMYFLAYKAAAAHEARPNTYGRNCIGVATSPNVTGPYQGEPTPIVCDSTADGTAMDPKSFDSQDGHTYLYYGSHRSPIMALRLDASRLRPAPGAVPTPTVHPDQSAYGSTVEAPWTYVDATGALTMLYSGSECCGKKAHYAVMAARSESGHPLGPWEKLGGPSGDDSVVLRSDPSGEHVTAPGHNAVVLDDAGETWILYHANVGKQCAQAYCSRQLFLGKSVPPKVLEQPPAPSICIFQRHLPCI